MIANGVKNFECANRSTYELPENHCAFCKHCTDIVYDYTNGPFMFLCDLGINNYIGCKNFKEDKMTESIKECNDKLKRENYKQCTDDMFMLFESFKESGFTDEQAFELCTIYVRQSVFDNLVLGFNRDRKDYSKTELLNKYYSLRAEMRMDETIKKAVFFEEKNKEDKNG